MKELWEVAFITPVREFLSQAGAFVPHLLAMIVIVAAGWVAAFIVKVVISRILKVMRFDQFSARVGLTQSLSKGGVTGQPSNLISRIVYWAILLIFLMLGLQALKLNAVDRFAGQAISYIPNLFVALIILIVGFILSNFFGRAMLIAAVNAQITQARLLARGVRLAVVLFALAMAFEQLGIATTIIVAAFTIAFGGVVLAIAIAFGLGGRDAAREVIEGRLRHNVQNEKSKEEDVSHF